MVAVPEYACSEDIKVLTTSHTHTLHGYMTDTYIEPLSIGQDDFVEHGQYDAHRSNQPPGQCHE